MAHSNMTVKVDLRYIPRKVQQVVHDERVLYELANTWRDVFNKYIPQGQTGELADAAHVTQDGYIIYNVPYAHYVWEGREYIWDAYVNEKTGEVSKLHFAPRSGEKTPSDEFGLDSDMYELYGWESADFHPHWEHYAYTNPEDHDFVAQHMTEFIKRL